MDDQLVLVDVHEPLVHVLKTGRWRITCGCGAVLAENAPVGVWLTVYVRHDRDTIYPWHRHTPRVIGDDRR